MLTSAKPCSKCFESNNSIKPFNKRMRGIPRPRKFKLLAKLIQLTTAEPNFEPGHCASKAHALNHSAQRSMSLPGHGGSLRLFLCAIQVMAARVGLCKESKRHLALR